jgi:hypothetical protein
MGARQVWIAGFVLFTCQTLLAAGIFVPRAGMIAPYATEADQEAFDRGFDLMLHRFSKEEGLGPQFNVESCGACHEGPVIGGTGPRYRDFYIHGVQSDDGTFEMAPKGGVVRSYGPEGNLRPSLMEGANVQAKRSGMVILGTGAISEIYEDAILANADPDDADGDGISGRAANVKGFLGRFGRDPINNHEGITSVALNSCAECQPAHHPLGKSLLGQLQRHHHG